MSPKLKQFFQDSKIRIFYPSSKEAKAIFKERPVNAVLASSIRLGILVSLPGIPLALAWYIGTDDNNRIFIKDKVSNAIKGSNKKPPPSPKP